MSNLNKFNTDLLNTLSEEEKRQVLSIMKEFSDTGKSKSYEELLYADYKEIPVDIETFLTDDNYLGRGLVDAEGRFTVFPYWVKTLKKLFPDKSLGCAYNTLVLTGGIGLGKSLCAVLSLLYMLYQVMCLKDANLHFGLQPMDEIWFSMINVTLESAKGVGWSKLQELVQASPWFLSHGKIKGKDNLEWQPDGKLKLVYGSNNNKLIGKCLIGNFTDEVNFAAMTSDVEKIKKKQMRLISQIDARMQSRFMKGTKLPTLNIIASSKDSEQAFMESYIEMKKKNESKTTLIIDEPQWVIRTDKDSPEKFYVAVGNKFLASEVLPKNADEELISSYRDKGFQMLQVPIGYYENFLDNVELALTDIAGISTVGALKYISGIRWKSIKTQTYKNPFSRDVIEVGTQDTNQYSDFFDMSAININDLDKPLYVHLDMSSSKDKTGIAGVWIKGRKENSDNSSSKELIYKVAFSVSIKAPKGDEIAFEKNRIFIRWLRDAGFNVKGVSSDTFQSTQIKQQLKADGFDATIVSVDALSNVPGTKKKICLPYQFFRSAIYEKLLEVYDKCDLLTDEVVGLEREPDGHINHPENGTVGCFTGDTKVKLADGRSLSFLELVDEYESGKQNYVYSFNIDKQKIEIKPILKAWKTLENQSLVRITLDNKKYVECTLNHKFMLSSSEYVEAQNLIPEDLLMSLSATSNEIHKVVSVEFIDKRADVYDIEVKDNHNFALDCNVFVHNSKDQCDAVCGSLYNASLHNEEYTFLIDETVEDLIDINDRLDNDNPQSSFMNMFEDSLKEMHREMQQRKQVTHSSSKNIDSVSYKDSNDWFTIL